MLAHATTSALAIYAIAGVISLVVVGLIKLLVFIVHGTATRGGDSK